jgi:hypothetical protein
MGMPLIDWILGMTMQMIGSPAIAGIILLICLSGFVAFSGVSSNVSILFFGVVLIWVAAPVGIGGVGALPIDIFYGVIFIASLFVVYGFGKFLEKRT